MRIKISISIFCLTVAILLLPVLVIPGSAFALTSATTKISGEQNQSSYPQRNFRRNSPSVNGKFNFAPTIKLSVVKSEIENAIMQRKSILAQDLVVIQTENALSQTASENLVSKIILAQNGLAALEPDITSLTTVASGNELIDKVYSYHVYTIIDRWVKLYATLAHLREKLRRLIYLKGLINTSISALAVSTANLNNIQSAYSRLIINMNSASSSIVTAISNMNYMTSRQNKYTSDTFSLVLPWINAAKSHLEISYEKLRYIFSALSTHSVQINIKNLATGLSDINK